MVGLVQFIRCACFVQIMNLSAIVMSGEFKGTSGCRYDTQSYLCATFVQGKKMAVKYGAIDSTLSLAVAFFINAAILILAAAAFFYKPGLQHQVRHCSIWAT